MKKMMIASTNKHKIQEFTQMLEKKGYTVLSLLDLDEVIEIEETGSTFEENARIKADYLCRYLNMECIADDSGLEIDCLNKEPGVYSARYMGYDTSYTIKNNELIKRVNTFTDRSCRFVCAIAYAKPSCETVVFRGTIEGQIHHKIEGENGFGYDPIFFYPPLNTTLALLTNEQKNNISHRFKALEQLMAYLYA